MDEKRYEKPSIKSMEDIKKKHLPRSWTQWDRGGGGCHITKVVCYALGLPDDCHQLNELRRFRDQYLNREGFSEEVEDYYANSKHYAKKIEEKARSQPTIYKDLYNKYILPAVKEIEQDNFEKAHEILRRYLNYVKNEL